MARVLDGVAVRRDEEHLQSDVDAGLFAGERQRLGGHLGTREADVPPIGLARDRDGLDPALHWAGPTHRDTANFRQDEVAVIEASAVAIFLVGEGVPAGAALEAREARLLASRHPPEERLIGPVEPGQHVLQDVAVEGGVLRHVRTDILQLGFLLVARDRDVAALPGGDALLQGGVGERATAPEHLV